MKGGQAIFRSEKLLRGLSITDDRIYVGGSDINFERKKRLSSDAAVYVLDTLGKVLATIEFASIGDIREIRQFSSVDYSLSSTASDAS